MVKRVAWLVPLLALSLALGGLPARADGVYHTHHYALTAIGDAPLRSGFVQNIHANGPNVYAHEIYQLNGGIPSTSFQVVLSIWTSNLSCSGTLDLQIHSADLVTNVSGNGKAQHVFTPQDADGLRGHTVSGIWQLLTAGSPVYQTGCEVVTLD